MNVYSELYFLRVFFLYYNVLFLIKLRESEVESFIIEYFIDFLESNFICMYLLLVLWNRSISCEVNICKVNIYFFNF